MGASLSPLAVRYRTCMQPASPPSPLGSLFALEARARGEAATLPRECATPVIDGAWPRSVGSDSP
eukprot:scaffold1199_cov265-Pinguiococcus_pyrenoidosus.AAC.8